MKYIIFLLGCLFLLCGFRGSLTTDQPVVPSGVFLTAKIGGGGWLDGADINSTDNTTLVRTDSYGAYLLNRSTKTFSQLVTQDSMPLALFGLQPLTGTSQLLENPAGAYEVASAPNNSSIMYIALGMAKGTTGHVLKSTNSGMTWADTAFASACTSTCAAINPNDQARMNGRKMAIDPANSNIVYIGTQKGGIYYTIDGNSWTAQSSVPTTGAGTCATSGACFPGYNIAFDTSGGTTNSCIGGASVCTANIYICAYSNGVYKSGDGGQTWALTTSGPTTCQHMVTAANTGIVLVIDGNAAANGFYWVYDGTWHKDPQSLGAHYHSIAADPANCASWASCHVAIGDNGGGLQYTQTAGSSPIWTAQTTVARTCAAGQPPWQCIADQFVLSNGDTIFEASGGILDLDGGQGFWTTVPTTSPSPAVTVTWASLVAGVEQVISGPVIAPNGSMIVGMQDLGVAALNTFPSTYPTFSGNVNTGPSLVSGWALDYASSNSTFMVNINGPEGNGNYDFSGTSIDGGQSWVPFNIYNTTVLASALTKCTVSNTICVSVSSGQASNFTTWSAGAGSIVTLLNVNPTVSEGVPNVTNNNFYVTVNPIGECISPCLKLTNPTITWQSFYGATGGSYLMFLSTRSASNGNGAYIIQNVTNDAGVVQITYTTNTQAVISDDPVCINSVNMTTTTVVNGCWLLSNVVQASKTADLYGSSFIGGDAYVSGGQMLESWNNGGAIASSTTTNFIRIPSNGSYPYCTTDGGQTWAELHAPSSPFYSTISTASWSGNVVTFTTNGAVDITTLSGNNSFTVTGSVNSAYNGTYTATGGSGTTVTAALVSNPGVWTASNAAVLSPAKTGWPNAYFSPGHVVVADRVTANTFYMYNYLAGIFKVTNCSTPTNVNTGSAANNGAANHKFGTNSSGLTTMKSVDGQAGHFFYTVGLQDVAGVGSHPAPQGLWRSCDGGVNMTIFSQFFEVIHFGFGKAAPGKSYPTIYVEGWYNASGTRASAVYGIYRSIDDPNNGATGVCDVATQTWQQLYAPTARADGNTQMWPLNWMAGSSDITGDLITYGRVYGGNNNGFIYGQFP